MKSAALKAEFPTSLLLWRERECHQDTNLDYLDSQLTALLCVEEATSNPPPMPLFREWGLELKKHASTP